MAQIDLVKTAHSAVVAPASGSCAVHVESADSSLAVVDSAGTLVSSALGVNTGDETVTTAGALINGATGKTTPVDADFVGVMDSAASNVLKKLSWANLKAELKTHFDAIYTLTLLGGVPTSRTVGGHALSSNVTLTTADVADSAGYRYCTDAEKTVIGNTSNTNTGDQTLGSLGAAPVNAPVQYCVDSGAADAYVVTPATAWTGYTAGQELRVRIAHDNTGACTINVSGLGVVSIKTQAGANPGAAALKTNGIYGMICDGSLLQLL